MTASFFEAMGRLWVFGLAVSIGLPIVLVLISLVIEGCRKDD